MKNEIEEHLLFKTDMFIWKQADEDLDRWFIGGDCAMWFWMRLLPLMETHGGLGPVMEDWGWYFEVPTKFTNVAVEATGFYEIENCWYFKLGPVKPLFRRYKQEPAAAAMRVVHDWLTRLLESEKRFKRFQWCDHNPWDDIKEF